MRSIFDKRPLLSSPGLGYTWREMEYRNYRVTRDDDDRRLDRIIRKFLPGVPLSAVYRLLRSGLIRVDGSRAKPDSRVRDGQTIMIAEALGRDASGRAEDTRPEDDGVAVSEQEGFRESGIRVLLETPDILVVNKPAGMPVHGEGGIDAVIPQAPGARDSLSFRTAPLHRLDKGTTGLLVLSRSLAGARWFSSAIAENGVGKEYVGLAEGRMQNEEEWSGIDESGRLMTTIARPIASAPNTGRRGVTLVSYRILTGRKHQIRIQTSEHDHPLIGDVRYGGERRAPAGDGVWLLHSWKLAFPPERPAGIPDKLTAPLPRAFARVILDTFGPNVLALFDNDDLYCERT